MSQPLLQCREIAYAPGATPVLTGATLTVAEGERVGLVGTNGCGKSSLIRILSGEIEPDDGEITRRRGLVAATVNQFLPPAMAAQRVIDVVVDGGAERHRAEALLTRLGIARSQLDQRAGDLSGGEVNRLLLARAVAAEPDVILLDEPTNHLDIETVAVFQRFLVDHLRRAFILVSHDQSLLDVLTDRTLFVREGVIHSFDLPYSRARHALLEQESARLALRDAQQKRIDGLTASMKRLAHWAHVYDNAKFARRARSMGKRVDRMKTEQQQTPWSDRRKLGIGGDQPRATRLLDVDNHAVATPDGKPLFHVDKLHVRRGDRVALLGINGSGKTTLLRILHDAFGRDFVDGVRFNPQVRLGYYDQELRQLAAERSLLATIQASTDLPLPRHRQVSALVGAGFPAREHDRPVASLSGGEKSRLLFLVLQLTKPNFVFLDEPTNHLDIEGYEALEAELLETELTVVFVSHDRRFTESVANRFIRIHDGALDELPSLDRYLDELEEPPARDAAPAKDRTPAAPADAPLGRDASQEEILERIVALEDRLAADERRKSKNRRPAMQKKWRAEIEALNARLE